jgi:hypothetical protein
MCFFVISPQGSDAEVHMQATLVAQQLKQMTIDPKDVAEARLLVERLKASALDPDVEKKMRAKGEQIAARLSELMKDEDFVKLANKVAQEFKAAMSDPIVQNEAKRFTEKMQVELVHESTQRRLFSPALNPAAAKTLPTGKEPAAGAVVPRQSLRPRADRITMADKMVKAIDQDGLFEIREQNIGKPSVNLIGKLGELRFATALSELGLLAAAEKAGVFSKLESAGAYSKAEALLPVVDKLGVLQFMQNTIDTEAGLLFTGGAWLTSLVPICYALTISGFLPVPEGPFWLVDGVLFSGTTASGVLLIGWSLIVGKLQED